MKKLFTLIALIASVAFVGCEKSGNDDNVASFTLSQTELEVDANGGATSIDYTLKNHQQGAVVIANCSASWIKELSTATVGQIKFNVAPNYKNETREATISVEYTAVKEKFEIKVKQAASDKPMFEYEVVINEPTHLSLNVTPADLTTAYICRAYTEEHIESFYLESDEALIAYDLETIEYEAYFSGQTLLNYLQNISNTGKGFDIEFTRLVPDTNYVVYCYHIDLSTGNAIGDVYREVIRTAKHTTATFDVEQTIEVDGAVITQTIKPADKSVYYYTQCWSVQDFYNYYGMSADMAETFVAKWNESITLGQGNGYQPYQLVEANCYQGDKTIVHDELKANTDYVIYLFSVDKETGFVSSDIILEEVKTGAAEESGMTIEIEVKDIFQTTANVYWTASDASGRFARSVFTKAEFDSWGDTDEAKIAYFYSQYSPIIVTGQTDMNLSNLTPGTDYVAFAWGVQGETPNTRIFKQEFTTLSNTPGTANVALAWDTHYNMAEVAQVDAEHWGDYATYTDHTLVPMSISGVTTTDEVYMMVTTMPKDYYNTEAEWLRDVAKEQFKINCYSNYNYVAEYEREYTVIAVAKDKNGNYGKLFIEEMYLYRSDDKPASEYTYTESK